MGIGDRLRALHARVGRRVRVSVDGGFVRGRAPDEPLESHLRYMATTGGFGTAALAEDVLALLDRLDHVEAL